MGALASLALPLVLSPAVQAATFSNATPLGPAVNAPLLPYPSAIAVGGMPGQVNRARATLVGVTAGPLRHLDVLLVGPGGKTILLSDVCSGGLSPDVSNLTFTFDDSAAPLPNDAACFGIPSGTYRPTDYQPGDVFPSVPPPYPVGLSNLNGTPSNGSWQLFARDEAEDPSSIDGGWRLELASGACARAQAKVPAHVGTAANDVLVGTPGADVMLGAGGRDTIRGLGGKDRICGGGGRDKLLGGGGKDTLLGQGGRDTLKGGGARDLCKGGGARDSARACEVARSL